MCSSATTYVQVTWGRALKMLAPGPTTASTLDILGLCAVGAAECWLGGVARVEGHREVASG